jgi:predicted O-linked N-acetylglucosamine transferase (SPINDLY family)
MPPDNRRFTFDRFLRHGITSDRLDLRELRDEEDPDKLYAGVDLVLDTFPYSSVEMVARSAARGVPCITLQGGRFAARTGASILSGIGRSDLVATTGEDYLALATTLAQAPHRLRTLRYESHRQFLASEIADASRFARRLETAYLDMTQAWAQEHPTIDRTAEFPDRGRSRQST